MEDLLLWGEKMVKKRREMLLEEEEIQKQREDVNDAKWKQHQWVLRDTSVKIFL